MHRIARYTLGSCILGAAAIGSSALAFVIAIGIFASQELATKESPELPPSDSESASHHGQLTFSNLVGTFAESTDSKLNLGSTNVALSNGEWVEVTDAVNMRSAPSSAALVLEVQLEGAQLRVSSRNGKWIEVVSPKSSREGWVYEKFVKPIAPISRQADLVSDSSG